MLSIALVALWAVCDAPGPEEPKCDEAQLAQPTNGPEAEDREASPAELTAGRSAPPSSEPVPSLPPTQLSPHRLRFDPPQPPHLLDRPQPTEEPPCVSPRAVDVVLGSARVFTPPPTAPGRRLDAPRVWSEVGLQTAAHWGAVKLYAEGLTRVDVDTPATAGSPRVRVSPRQRVGLDASPTDRLHFGLEFSRRGERGVDPLPTETRATANMRLHFGW